ncbi:MAG TPA: ATP-binding protein [Gemmatimonadales bacterium]|nr:ATP-binding protein [Gemmatimonadales bacterium]
MTTPAPLSTRPVRRAPSITRLFVATFFAVTLAGLTIALTSWINARQTQQNALAVMQTLDQLRVLNPSPALEQQRSHIRDIVLDLSDSAQQAALGTTIITVAVLIALGIGLVYSRRRLAEPFGTIVAALERVETGEYDLHLPEDGAEFGTIGRGVNRMSQTLAWRARIQEYTSRLLAALNAAPREGAGLTPALDVIAEATGSAALVLYQPDYEANEWEPTAARSVTGSPVSRITVRDIVGEAGSGVLRLNGDQHTTTRAKLKLPPTAGAETVVAPLRSAGRLMGLLVALPAEPLTPAGLDALTLALPNLAIACERESAFQHTRRLATEVRKTAMYLEEQSDELTRLNEELAKANRLKSDFLANMSHELRTPLNSIIGFSDMLLTEEIGALSDTQRDFLETVARNGRHLLQLISELLDLSKIEAGHLKLTLEPIDLRQLLHEAADSVRAQTEKRRHRFDLDLPGDPLSVTADHVRVRQVLLNLLSNAIKFTPEGGQVRLAGRPDSDGVRVEVVDTGIGISPTDQQKLFREFVQLDPSASRHYEGTGLGLALCKRLVELHGGRIGVDSDRGRGSTFWFTLPSVARPSSVGVS